MARKQLQNMQLPESGYNPIVFQGYTTEGPEYDTNILANSIGRLDTAIEKAHDAYSAIDLALAEQGNKLNEAENKWFNDFKQNYKDQIQAEIDAGNFGNAINLGKRLGAEAVSDKGLNARIQYNQDLEQFKNDIENRQDLTTSKKRWAIHKYGKYDYHDELENGKVIGGNTFNKDIPVSSSWNPDQEWSIVNQLLPEESGGGGGTKHSDDLSRSTTSSTTYHRKKAKNLLDAMDKRLSESSELRSKLGEELEAELYNRQYLLDKYNELKDTNPEEAARFYARWEEETKKLTPPGGDSPVTDYKTYYKLKVIESAYPQIMSYNNVTNNSSESINSSNDYGGKSTIGRVVGDFIDGLREGFRKSDTVEYATDNDASAQNASKKGSNIMPVGNAE